MNISILTHENIPKPLHGTAPRVVKKSPRGWWLNEKRQVLARANEHCECCNVHQSQSRYRAGRLEVHEQYDIDHKRGRMTYAGSVALCHTCHAFIHSGRLYAMWSKQQIGNSYFETVMLHGFNLLREAGLKPAFTQAVAWLQYIGNKDIDRVLQERGIVVPSCTVAWDDWRLVVDGEEFCPVMTEKEWSEKYG